VVALVDGVYQLDLMRSHLCLCGLTMKTWTMMVSSSSLWYAMPFAGFFVPFCNEKIYLNN